MKKATKKEIEIIKEAFIEKYKDAVTELDYKNDYELLIAIILSAQCTDKRVNIITPALFLKYPGVYELADASLGEVKDLLKSCSFFNNKAKNIIKMAQVVCKAIKPDCDNCLFPHVCKTKQTFHV
jgi:endonuclease-3